jgi:hypothetical protein
VLRFLYNSKANIAIDATSEWVKNNFFLPLGLIIATLFLCSICADNAKLHEVEGQHSQNCNKRTLSKRL